MAKYFPKSFEYNSDIKLAFIKSTNVHVYPCGRRNSTIIKNNENTYSDDCYIPFDPEARLNTEYNNTNLSGTNGFTQNFIRSVSDEELKLVVGGYEFKFTDYTSIAELFGELTSPQVLTMPKDIYVNIRLEKTPLYSNGSEVSDSLLYYDTWILRNQSYDNTSPGGPSPTLDQLIETTTKPEISSYYFSGISFSDAPLSSFDDDCTTKVKNTWSMTHYAPEALFSGSQEQIVYSLHIAVKNENKNTYEIYQPALLPQIRHGEEEDEIEITNLKVEGYGVIDGDLTVHGNVRANDRGKNAAFYDVDITTNLDVGKDTNIGGNTTLRGNLKADTNGTTANFYDVGIERNLKVGNTTQTDKLIAKDARIDGEIYRVHNGEAMGLVTMKVIDGVERADEDKDKTKHTRKRIVFFTKKAASLPNIRDVVIRDL